MGLTKIHRVQGLVFEAFNRVCCGGLLAAVSVLNSPKNTCSPVP